MSRFKNSVRNSTTAVAWQVLNALITLVVRHIFIKTLGGDYLGVNGVMESMIRFLSVTELGIGASVAFLLYRPVACGDERKIGTLMAFYRRAYHTIAVFTFIIGILLFPFLKNLVKDAPGSEKLPLIWLIFLIDSVIDYTLSYKRTLINAYQNNYINTVNMALFRLLRYALQIAALLIYKSYIAYLLIHLLSGFLSDVHISNYCDRKYPFLKTYRKEKLTKGNYALLKKSVTALLYHRVGLAIMTGMSDLIISKMSVALMGLYSNYTLAIATVNGLVSSVLQSITASVGDLMVQSSIRHKYKIYEEIVFVNFCLHFSVAVVFAGCLERFIAIITGGEGVLSGAVTFLVILNFFLHGMRHANMLVIETAGLFGKLKLKVTLEAVIQPLSAIFFIKSFNMGLCGVLLGGCVSSLFVCTMWEAGVVHRYAFETSAKEYVIKYFYYLFTASFVSFINYFICRTIPHDGVLALITSFLVSALLAFVTIVLLYSKTDTFKNAASRITIARKRAL